MTQKETLKPNIKQVSAPSKDLPLLSALVLADSTQIGLLPEAPFERAGCHTTFVDTITAARAHLEQTIPDIIFLPLALAERSSLPFIDYCKSKSPAPFVIIVASHDQINIAAEAMHAGAFDCLFKPFSASRLDQTIHDAVRARRPIATPIADERASEEYPPARPVNPPNHQDQELAPKPHHKAASSVSIGTAATLSYPQDLQPATNEDKCPSTETPGPTAPANNRPTAREKLIGSHVSFTTALRLLDSAAPSTAPTFLRGELGTGKELFARAMHEVSGRTEGRFVVVDCATLRAETLASDMFGHLRGAVPGATQDKRGAALLADGGTLYFDEISNLDLQVQRQLVRFVQTGEVLRLGDDTPTKTDVRLISSTSHDPMQMIQEGYLLKDLYYQLHVVPITVPSLRVRGDDMVALANVFLADYARSEQRGFTAFTDEALQLLRQHHWPGNVHELKNTIWNAVLQNDGKILSRDMLPATLRLPQCPQSALSEHPYGAGTDHLIGRPLAEIEQIIIEETIRAHGGSVPKAARTLEVSPSTLYRKRETWQA